MECSQSKHKTKPKPKPKPKPRTKSTGLRDDGSAGSKKGFLSRLFSRRSAKESHPQTIRAIGEDSVIITDPQLMDEINEKRLKKLNDLKESKGFTKVKGEIRYIRKDKRKSKLSSLLSKFKAKLGIGTHVHNRQSLEPQKDRSDTTVERVNKTVGQQSVTTVKESPTPVLRDPFDAIAIENSDIGKQCITKRPNINVHDSRLQSKLKSAAQRCAHLKGLILYDMALKELANIDCEYLFEMEFGHRKDRRLFGQVFRKEMFVTIKRKELLLRANKISLGKFLGKGGQALIFMGRYGQRGYEKKVAVKLPFFESEPHLAKELELLKKLSGHPKVIQTIDLGTNSFMAMELAEGSLDSYLSRKFNDNKTMLSLESCRRFAKDIAMGLKYIHSK